MSDLLKGNNILSQAEIEDKYGIRVNVIDYNSIRLKMGPILTVIKNRNNGNALPAIPPRTYIVLHSKSLSQVVSHALLTKLNKKNEDIARKI